MYYQELMSTYRRANCYNEDNEIYGDTYYQESFVRETMYNFIYVYLKMGGNRKEVLDYLQRKIKDENLREQE